jgi:hypothetical protein
MSVTYVELKSSVFTPIIGITLLFVCIISLFWSTYKGKQEALNNTAFVQTLQVTVGTKPVDLYITSNTKLVCIPKTNTPFAIECNSGN